MRTARENGLSFYDLPLSATRRPARHRVAAIDRRPTAMPLSALDPLQIGCRPDRAGFGTLPHARARRNPGAGRAGVFARVRPCPARRYRSICTNRSTSMPRWLKANRLPHTPERFRDWVKNDYQSADPPSDPPLYPAGAGQGLDGCKSVAGHRPGSIEQIPRPDLLKLRQFVGPTGDDRIHWLAGEDLLISRSGRKASGAIHRVASRWDIAPGAERPA